MASYTAGAVADKISELRSKIAVFETLCAQIRNNYLSSDAGPGELRITRKDGATVTQGHLKVSITDFEEHITALHEELEEWEGLTFNSAPELPEDTEEAEEAAVTAKAVKVAKEKKNAPAKRAGQHSAATK